MNFALNDSQKVIQSRARAFAVDVVKPRLAEMESNDRFPIAVRSAMSDAAFWGMPYPEDYGGSQDGYLGYVLAMEEISKQSVAVGATLSVHTLGAAAIFHYGTEEQK